MAKKTPAATRKSPVRVPFLLLAVFGLTLLSVRAAFSPSEEIPLEGNAYFTTGVPAKNLRLLDTPGKVLSAYVYCDRAADLQVSFSAAAEKAGGQMKMMAGGVNAAMDVPAGAAMNLPSVTVHASAPGYLRMMFESTGGSGPLTIQSLKISPEEGAQLLYVRDNQDNRFYWGRRGASVHLGYELPQGVAQEYFYNEVTVPEGADPVGSYFMANGFGEGYFGMQVNGSSERRILFSVWSPFSTDHPGEIPEDQKVKLLKKGEGVHGGEFGGEGAGGQSYWNYPWKAGETYRFLNRAQPDGHGSSRYTAWFYVPETGSWKLIASFLRPHTDTHLRGVHSFLENFSDFNGYKGRAARYGNQWACDATGKWTEITVAHFTCDDIGQRRWRTDFGGGVDGKAFTLRNGGFEVPAATPQSLSRQPAPERRPQIEFDKLEGSSL